MEYLNSDVRNLTIPNAAMSKANALTVIDVSTLMAAISATGTFKACVINAVMIANKSATSDLIACISVMRGATEVAILHNATIGVGQTLTTRPEGFLNLRSTDKIVIWFTNAQQIPGQFADAITSYLLTTDD